MEARRFQANDPGQAISHMEKAVQLYRGEFLEGYTSGGWQFQRRQELEREYLNALMTLGQLYFAQTRYGQAADAYLKAIATDSYLETAHRELMRCYSRLGEHGQALRHYQELVELLHDEVGTPPAPETQVLYAQLQRGKSI
jgi:DNA-binding SARP family transcriptional activator